MDKLIVYGADARNRIVHGAEKLENIVASTLGPKGHNVIISDGGVRPLITKDGATVSSKTDSDDPFEKIGMQLIKDVVSKVDSVAGDGTTTTTIYSTNLLKETNDLINLGVDPNEVRKGIDAATKEAVESLEKHAVKTDDIAAVAHVATNGSNELVDLLVEAYSSIGENGSVVLADSYKRDGSSYVEVSKGIDWEGGIPSSLFITNSAEDTAVVEDPLIMVVATGVQDLEPLMPYIDITRKLERNFVVVAPYFEPKLFSKAASEGILLLMSPGTSFRHVDLHEALMDLAVTIGTKVVPDLESAQNVVPDVEKDLGHAKLIVASVKSTKITQVDELEEEKAEQYEAYIEKLKAAIGEDSELAQASIESLKERIARLSGGIATVHVGGLTPEEKEEKIALVQDAQNSIRSALDYGILPGGGTALLKVAQELADKKHDFSSEAMRKGYEAVLKVMRLLAKRLVASVKPEDYQYIVQQVAHEKDFWAGYNVRTEQIEDLKSSKIFDSAAIEILAMRYTASAVGSFAISDGVIVNKVPNLNYDVNDRRILEATK